MPRQSKTAQSPARGRPRSGGAPVPTPSAAPNQQFAQPGEVAISQGSRLIPGVMPPPVDPLGGIEWGPDGILTERGMQAAIRQGRTVLHKGVLHGNIATLPTGAELAGDDESKQEQARRDLAARREELDRQEAILNRRSGERKAAQANAPKPRKGAKPDREQRPDAAIRDDDGRPLVSGAVSSTIAPADPVDEEIPAPEDE